MKFLATLILFALLSANALAQKPISIETPDFLFYQHIKNTVQNIIVPYSILDPQSLGSAIGVGDTNTKWDFSKVGYVREEQSGIDSAIAYPSNAPLASDSDFTKSTEILMLINPNKPTLFSFLRFTNDGIFNLGMTQDSAGIATKISGWSPPYKEMQIPIRYGSNWQNTSTLSGNSLKSGERKIVSVQAKVDAWGTMLLPKLYSLPALRVKKQIIVTDVIDGLASTNDTTYEYDFISYFTYQVSIFTNAKNEIQRAEYSANFTPSAVRSSPDDQSNFTITDNPAADAGTKVIYSLKNEGQVRIEVMDELGKSTRILLNQRVSAGRHTVSIDPEMFGNGAYFVRFVSPEMTVMKKLIISR